MFCNTVIIGLLEREREVRRGYDDGKVDWKFPPLSLHQEAGESEGLAIEYTAIVMPSL